MKRKLIVLTTFLASIGLLAGISSQTQNEGSFEMVSAEKTKTKVAPGHDIDYTSKGSIFLQLESDVWKTANSKIVLYMSRSSTGEWGDFVVPSGSSKYIEYSFDLGFIPTECRAFEVSSDVVTPDDAWLTNTSSDSVLYYTNSIDFSNVIYLCDPISGKKTDYEYFDLEIYVNTCSIDDFDDGEVTNTQLAKVRIDQNDRLEVYGNVPISNYFAVNYYGHYTAHSLISSYFNSSDFGHISCSKAGTYTIRAHFNYDTDIYVINNIQTYITTPTFEFGDLFLDKTAGYCSSNISTDVQNELKAEYDSLYYIDEAQAQIDFYTAEVKRGKDLEYDSSASEALSRYVDMQNRGYTDFLGLGAHNPVYSSPLVGFENRSYGGTIVVIVLATTITITGLSTLILLKKRKHF